jgi:predicted acylesterase/phospholipase RssA
MASSKTEFDRDAVITIQGGGLHALNLLGQLEAVMEARLVPRALAGTSAGAIVATLLWARLTPAAARDRIIDMATPSLVNLLGPFASPPKRGFGFAELRQLVADCKRCLSDLESSAAVGWWRWRKLKAQARIPFSLWKLKRRLAPHVERRGLFAGLELERQIDLILRSAPDFVKYRHELPDLKDWPDRVRFRHFRHLAEAHPDECYRPLLFLAATNLTSRRLELFNSIDDVHQTVAVASAVRASAGFPLFFAPTQVSEGGWYVDGGVVSNFPAWVFTHEFRRRMETEPRFAGLSMRPWVHIGLRVVDDPLPYAALADPAEYLKALFAMLRGQSRNVLEELLADRMPRLKLINQPVSETKAPGNSLDFEQVSEQVVRRMFDAGRDFARGKLASISFSVPSGAASEVIEELQRLVDAAGRIFPSPNPIRFRSNIFLRAANELVLRYSFNMENDPDKQMVLSSTGGLTGACYRSRSPLICNLQKVRDLATTGNIEPRDLFNMTPAQQAQVEPGRTWLCSVPIFDPFDSTTVPQSAHDSSYRFGYYYFQLASLVDGAVLGVLNLDVNWSYVDLSLSPDPEVHFAEPRIRAIVDLMRVASSRVGLVLGSWFGRS